MQPRPALIPRAQLASSASLPLAWVAIGAAWLVAAVAQMSGQSALLHHHALIEGGPPIGISVLLFAVGWLTMTAAMMLPASLGAIGTYESAAAGRSGASVAAFVGAFFLVWLVVGMTFFMGDVVLHAVVEATPWIAERAWVLEAGVVGLAGAYQFVPLKRRFLEACRQPQAAAHVDRPGFEAGVAHAVDCLVSSGPMMLLMFAAGLANVWWMLGLAGVMAYEARGRHGQRVASVAGAALLALALLALTHAGLPAWAA